MAHTNRGRVILGGLLAGVVINVVEFVTNGVILKDAWGEAMQAMNKPAQPSGSEILLFNIWGFLLGIAAVWLYAGIRSRYGAGVATALRAGLAVWFLSVFLADLGLGATGIFPVRLMVITGLVELFEIPIATVVGAWLYKEEAQSPAVSRAAA
jgi:hypothetical protein